MGKSSVASYHLLKESFDDENEDVTDDIKVKRKPTMRRHHTHCRKKRLSHIVAILFFVIILVLMVYIPILNNYNSRRMPVPGWEYNISKNIADYVYPNLDTVFIEPHSVCMHNFFVLIVVCSSVDNFKARQMIRETWGNVSEFNYSVFSKMHSHLHDQYLNVRDQNIRLHSDYLNLPNITENYNSSNFHLDLPVRVVFLIGKHDYIIGNNNETSARLKLESEQYDDLIQEDFIDSYNNLTIKSVMMLKWIQNKCNNRMRFIVKCDDDTFVNVPNLLHLLLGGTIPIYNDSIQFYTKNTINALSSRNRLLISQNLLMGHLFCNVRPVNEVGDKWYAPYSMYEYSIYPNYLSGSSYLMSHDVIERLFKSSLNTTILHLEDVYLTGICAKKIGLQRRHSPLFFFNNKKNKCSYKGIITQHYLKGNLMRDVYNFVSNTTIQCPPPAKDFRSNRLSTREKNCN